MQNRGANLGFKPAAPGLMIMCHEAHVRVHIRVDGVTSDGFDKVYSPVMTTDRESPAWRDVTGWGDDVDWLDRPKVTCLQTGAKVAVSRATVRAFKSLAVVRLGRGGDVVCVKLKRTTDNNTQESDSESEPHDDDDDDDEVENAQDQVAGAAAAVEG
jgi:hypothetical protein